MADDSIQIETGNHPGGASKIIDREPNTERKLFYELCWHLGGSQSDIAQLHAEDIDWTDRTVSFVRVKLRNRTNLQPPIIHFGPQTEKLFKQLPRSGLLFPYLAASEVAIALRSSNNAATVSQSLASVSILIAMRGRNAQRRLAIPCGSPWWPWATTPRRFITPTPARRKYNCRRWRRTKPMQAAAVGLFRFRRANDQPMMAI